MISDVRFKFNGLIYYKALLFDFASEISIISGHLPAFFIYRKLYGNDGL